MVELTANTGYPFLLTDYDGPDSSQILGNFSEVTTFII